MLEYGDKGDLVCLGLMRKRVCAELDLLRRGTGVLTVVCRREDGVEDGVGQSALSHASKGLSNERLICVILTVK